MIEVCECHRSVRSIGGIAKLLTVLPSINSLNAVHETGIISHRCTDDQRARNEKKIQPQEAGVLEERRRSWCSSHDG